MIELQQYRLVLTVADTLSSKGGWAGETHLQKVGYFLQELCGVSLNCEFILYKHGPFSFDLRGVLSTMRAYEFVDWQTRAYGYGPVLVEGPLADTLKKFTEAPPEETLRRIEFIADKLGARRVTYLERVATALFVKLEGTPAREQCERIHQLKPHVSRQEAEEAVRDLEEIWSEAVELQFIGRPDLAQSA